MGAKNPYNSKILNTINQNIKRTIPAGIDAKAILIKKNTILINGMDISVILTPSSALTDVIPAPDIPASGSL